MTDMMDSLVSTQWLEEPLGEADLRVVDSGWHMPKWGRSGRGDFLAAHIPGAVFFDIDELSDHSDPSPHMLPAAKDFAAAMKRPRIRRDDPNVALHNSPIHTAARGWFTLRHFGATQVAILDGGFQKWIAEGRPAESGAPPAASAFFAAEPRTEVVTKDEILAGVDTPLLDARGRPRFEGTAPDPRPGVAPGHIPGARNMPFEELYYPDGTFRDRATLRVLFELAGIDPARPFVASCGSGVTAASLLFAAHLLGNDETRLYDGSWAEGGGDPATPKALGPAA